jgi:hypothetical protein
MERVEGSNFSCDRKPGVHSTQYTLATMLRKSSSIAADGGGAETARTTYGGVDGGRYDE